MITRIVPIIIICCRIATAFDPGEPVAVCNVSEFPRVSVKTASGRKLSGVLDGVGKLSNEGFRASVQAVLQSSRATAFQNKAGETKLLIFAYQYVVGAGSPTESMTGWADWCLNLLIIQKGWAEAADFDDDGPLGLAKRQAAIKKLIADAPGLIETFADKEKDIKTRVAAIQGLASVGYNARGADAALKHIIENPDLRENPGGIREFALIGLGHVGVPDATIPYLLQCRAEFPAVCMTAISLFRSAARSAERQILDSLLESDGDGKIYWASYSALEALGPFSPDSIKAIKKASQDETKSIEYREGMSYIIIEMEDTAKRMKAAP